MFDIRVQHRDRKTGRIQQNNTYRLHIVQGKRYFERPTGSGHLYYESNEPAGQLVWENDGKKKVIKEGAEHRAYSKPLTVNEQMQREFDGRGTKIQSLEAKIAELEAASIKEEAAVEVAAVEAAAKVVVAPLSTAPIKVVAPIKSEVKPKVVAKPAVKGK